MAILGCKCLNRNAKNKIIDGLRLINPNELIGEPMILANQKESEFQGISSSPSELISDAIDAVRQEESCEPFLQSLISKETGLGNCLCLSNISKDLMLRGLNKLNAKDDSIKNIITDIKNMKDCGELIRERERHRYIEM